LPALASPTAECLDRSWFGRGRRSGAARHRLTVPPADRGRRGRKA